jgi:hypothetical protein
LSVRRAACQRNLKNLLLYLNPDRLSCRHRKVKHQRFHHQLWLFPEVTQLTRDLGWRQGYFVSFYRINKEKDDQTGIRQSINIFPIENMNKIFSIEKEDMKSRADRSGTIYEIPFPTIGDTSIAFRGTDANDPNNFVVYSVLFTKKNVYEKITMTGTSTDYEVLKDIAQRAAEKIR